MRVESNRFFFFLCVAVFQSSYICSGAKTESCFVWSCLWIDGLRSKLSLPQVRRLFTALSAYLPCVFFGVAATCGPDRPLVGAFCVSMGLSCSAFNTAGWLMTFMDVAPAYASIVYGFSNMIAALPGVISSTVAGAVIERTGSISAREALLELDINSSSLTRRISEIQERGTPLVAERKVNERTGKRYTRYSLREVHA